MSEPLRWHTETWGNRAVENLRKHNFTAEYMDEGKHAVAYILERIPSSASVGIGGSQTERALGIGTSLTAKGCTVYDHNIPGLSLEERNNIRYRQLTTDFFICGTNAITIKGELINRDAFGNRVASMIFGPKTVFIIAGINKVVRNIEEAEQRIRSFAAPMNNKKYNLPNPCTEFGECVDCNSSMRLCNITTIISRCPPLTDIHILLIGQNFGF